MKKPTTLRKAIGKELKDSEFKILFEKESFIIRYKDRYYGKTFSNKIWGNIIERRQ